MSHVDFKKRPCRPVGFKGEEAPVWWYDRKWTEGLTSVM